MVNSLRMSFLTKKDVTRESNKVIIVKPNHQRGRRHQSGYFCGEKSNIRLTTTRKGNAISMANEDRNASVFDGTCLLPIIQKPSIPIPRRAATVSNVMKKMVMRFSLYWFYIAQATGI